MKQVEMRRMLFLIWLAGLLVQTGCCSKSGDQKKRSSIPWGSQVKTGAGGLPGSMNEQRR